MFFTPERLIMAGNHKPTRTRRIDPTRLWPLLMNCSTYNTQPTAMAAFPAQAVIQYDQALRNPTLFPKATRAYAYGPPSAGRRRDSEAKSIASTSAPMVVRAMEISVIG